MQNLFTQTHTLYPSNICMCMEEDQEENVLSSYFSNYAAQSPNCSFFQGRDCAQGKASDFLNSSLCQQASH